jgi:hypothetical protein
MGKKKQKSEINLIGFITGAAIVFFILLAVYVLLSFFGIFTTANEMVCIRNRGTLKYVYQMYNAVEGKKVADRTLGVAFLVAGGYVTNTQAKSASLGKMVWRVYENGAVDVFCTYDEAVLSVYDYESSFFGQDNVIALKGSWKVGNGLLSPAKNGENRAVFGPTDGTDYTIELSVEYIGGDKEHSGYGIYYRATKTSAPSGYIFQFDPGSGKSFTVRKVSKGKESAPFQQISMLKAMGKNFDMNQPHDIKIVVAGQNQVISVDGIQVLNFTDPAFSSGIVGVRTWNDSNVRFFKVSVIKQ